MLDLFALLLILICSSDTFASPVRRYTNDTRISADCFSKSSSSTSVSSTATSPLVINGPTSLASFLLPTQETTQSGSATETAAAEVGSATAESVQTSPITFSYAPLPYNQSTTAIPAAQPTHSALASLSDWTLTLTTYTTVTANLKVTTSTPDYSNYFPHSVALSASATAVGSVFSYNSVPTASESRAVLLSTTTIFAQPYFSTTSPSTISASVTSLQPSFSYTAASSPPTESASSRTSATESSTSEHATQHPSAPPATSPTLPEIVASPTAPSSATSTTSGIAGITIVPLDPSVIYITTTVTDAGATTTIDGTGGKETVTVTVR